MNEPQVIYLFSSHFHLFLKLYKENCCGHSQNMTPCIHREFPLSYANRRGIIELKGIYIFNLCCFQLVYQFISLLPFYILTTHTGSNLEMCSSCKSLHCLWLLLVFQCHVARLGFIHSQSLDNAGRNGWGNSGFPQDRVPASFPLSVWLLCCQQYKGRGVIVCLLGKYC
jgi:hypothetical protein